MYLLISDNINGFDLGGEAVSGAREEKLPKIGLGTERVGRGGEGESRHQAKEARGP